MVTLVRPSSMFLKCLKVMAKPATIAGRYNRSSQFNLGRGTVTAISGLIWKPGIHDTHCIEYSWFPGFQIHNLGMKGRIAATIKIFTSAISKKNSHPSRMSWSQRNRGSVQRTHMKTKIMTATFAKKTAMLMRPKIHPCEPSGIPGKCQPPKKNGRMTAAPVIIGAYSPKKYKANFIELYSIL